MRVGLVVGALCLFGCGVEQEPEAAAPEVAKSQEALVSFGVGTDLGFVNGPVLAATVDPRRRLYARRASDSRLIKYNASTMVWTPDWSTSEAFSGRPAPVNLGDAFSNCNAVFVRKFDGAIGYVAEVNYGSEFGVCEGSASTFLTTPSLLGIAGAGPAATAQWNGSSLRYDVFAPQMMAGSYRVASLTGTGSTPWTTTWGSWSYDSAISVMGGTSPAAVSVVNGRIDLFVCESATVLMWKTLSGGVWSAWTPVATGCYSTPTVTGRWFGTGPALTVVTKSSTGRLIARSYNPGPFSPGWSANWDVLSNTTTYDVPSIGPGNGSSGSNEVWTRNSADGLGWYANY